MQGEGVTSSRAGLRLFTGWRREAAQMATGANMKTEQGKHPERALQREAGEKWVCRRSHSLGAGVRVCGGRGWLGPSGWGGAGMLSWRESYVVSTWSVCCAVLPRVGLLCEASGSSEAQGSVGPAWSQDPTRGWAGEGGS